jgi:ABC-type Fe3+/spermidine/putrescine transport system ATPase subunit
MVFQNYALYPHMTVAENMAFSLTLAGATKADKTRKVKRAADILGLTPLLERYPRRQQTRRLGRDDRGVGMCVSAFFDPMCRMIRPVMLFD